MGALSRSPPGCDARTKAREARPDESSGGSSARLTAQRRMSAIRPITDTRAPVIDVAEVPNPVLEPPSRQVRLAAVSGHDLDLAIGRRSAASVSGPGSSEQLVGANQQRERHVNPKRLGVRRLMRNSTLAEYVRVWSELA